MQFSDNTRPDATIACKCRVMENKKLLFYKAGFVLPRVLSSHANLTYYMVVFLGNINVTVCISWTPSAIFNHGFKIVCF